jgi:serine protease Do
MNSMKPLNKSLAALVLGGGAVGAFFGANALHNQWAGAQQPTQEQVSKAEDLATVFRDVGKRVGPSVVKIEVHKTVKAPGNIPLPDDMLRRFFPPNGQQPPPDGNGDGGGDDENAGPGGGSFEQVGTGSGVVMEVNGRTGYILTNNHVAGGASEMSVTLADGRKIDDAKLVGADPKTDLAVIQIEADDLKAAKWGDSGALLQGDWIMAFGSPFGYVGSMTHGIVSALNRSQVGILGNQGYEDFIQVDAPINPGNSGGPLVNLRGDVVGVNTAIASRNGGFQGIGFAIPINEAKWVYGQLKDHHKVTRGWLGVGIKDVAQDPEVAKGIGYEKTTGVLVEWLTPESPANGKLEPYDVITEINSQPVRSVTELRNRIAEEAPGNTIHLNVFRNGKTQSVDVKLGTQPENLLASQNRMVPQGAPGSASRGAQALGMRLSNPTADLSERLGIPQGVQGAVIVSVAPHSAAEKAQLSPGDVITQIDRKPVHNAQEAADQIAKHSGKGSILLYVENAGGGHIAAVPAPK